MELLSNNIVLLALTFGVYYGARQLQKWTGWVVLNPILVTIAVLIVFLKLTGISYDTYQEGGHYIDFWLKPAIVALGVPLYQHLGQIRRQFVPIIVSQLVGCLVGLVSVVLIARWMGASREVIISLAPKSVTTPIAMEVCSVAGGIPSLTAAIVVCVGLLGAVFGFKMLEVWHVRNPYSQGLGLGAASHAVGTSRAMEKGDTYGAYASLGLILNGVLTALLTTYVLRLMGVA
ncbi:MAG: LrgB family protein [Bacteroidales bacterium]|nr:LrgB family protein [Bacteroidales bacterium]MEE0923416.1 LrgB family protein [Paludibacteraceae bacterium]MEE1140052.1 LrgB family protein [Prevotella sp.]